MISAEGQIRTVGGKKIGQAVWEASVVEEDGGCRGGGGGGGGVRGEDVVGVIRVVVVRMVRVFGVGIGGRGPAVAVCQWVGGLAVFGWSGWFGWSVWCVWSVRSGCRL
jgi:hypothetical protein